MNQELHALTVQLLDKTWQMRCPEDKIKALQKCVRLLDTKMREMVEGTQNKNSMNERFIINAALHVIYDLLTEHDQKELYITSLSSHIRELQSKIATNNSN